PLIGLSCQLPCGRAPDRVHDRECLGTSKARPLAMIASPKASSTAGFIAVSLAAAMASGGAPASPLLNCKYIDQCLLLANSVSARPCFPSVCKSAAGSQVDW